MRIWGYWATFGWALLAFLVGQFVALAVLVWWRVGELNTLLDVPFDGIAVALFILIANPITIGILMLAVRLARASQAEYLALAVPQTRDLRVGIICIIGLIAISDALLYFTGQPLVTPFQLQSYSTAAAEGWLAPFLIAAVIVAPASEEIIFRGILVPRLGPYGSRGLARDRSDLGLSGWRCMSSTIGPACCRFSLSDFFSAGCGGGAALCC